LHRSSSQASAMDRKRALEPASASAPGPPSKHARTASAPVASIAVLQRAQLAAKVADQARELAWARAKIDELQYAVTALDAAPMSANYYMAACAEELALALTRAGVDPGPAAAAETTRALLPPEELEATPVAAVLLDDEVVTNETLGEQPKALKRLAAHVILALENMYAQLLQQQEVQQQQQMQIDHQKQQEQQHQRQSLAKSSPPQQELDHLEQHQSPSPSRELKPQRTPPPRQQDIVMADLPPDQPGNDTAEVSISTQDLRARLRRISDQLERYADRDKANIVASTTLRDELDDLRSLLDIRRRKIVSLELALRTIHDHPDDDAVAAAAASAAATTSDVQLLVPAIDSAIRQSARQEEHHPPVQSGSGDRPSINGNTEHPNASSANDSGGATYCTTGELHAVGPSDPRVAGDSVRGSAHMAPSSGDMDTLRELADKRLAELGAMLEEKNTLSQQIQNLTIAAAQRAKGIIPLDDVAATAQYQTMEAALQQLLIREKEWESEREAALEELDSNRAETEANMAEFKASSLKENEELRRHVEDLRRVAESAKAEKDKWVMTYEARKLEANGAISLVEATEKRVSFSEEVRAKLKASNDALQAENADFRARVTESELRATGLSSDLVSFLCISFL
jgi:hypothetical protein